MSIRVFLENVQYLIYVTLVFGSTCGACRLAKSSQLVGLFHRVPFVDFDLPAIRGTPHLIKVYFVGI